MILSKSGGSSAGQGKGKCGKSNVLNIGFINLLRTFGVAQTA